MGKFKPSPKFLMERNIETVGDTTDGTNQIVKQARTLDILSCKPVSVEKGTVKFSRNAKISKMKRWWKNCCCF